MSNQRPMLAAPITNIPIQFPVYVSPKLDGIRGTVWNPDTILTRTLKPIPNKFVQEAFKVGGSLKGLDGELVVGPPTSKTAYLDSVSGLMTQEGKPSFNFWVFDHVEMPTSPFKDRLQVVQEAARIATQVIDWLPFKVIALEQRLVEGVDELLLYEDQCLWQGYEGVILRHPMGLYKHGRSTENQGWMLKLKRFTDSEAVILGFVEGFTNENTATINELGYTERSSHKEHQVPAGTLGALKVRDCVSGCEFEIGTGFTAAQRQEIWDNRDKWLSQVVKYQYFPVGMKDKPRHPSYKGPRAPLDMG